MINVVNLSHQILSSVKNPSIAIDMTCGNGYDSLFLAKIAKFVYAFDIQDEAITNTKKLLNENDIENVKVIKESHDLFDIFISENIDMAIYNLGYLPSGRKDIKTNALIVLNSLRKVLEKLNPQGIVVIVVYLHDIEESVKISEFVSSLGHEYDVVKHEVMNKSLSPYLIEIRKL